MANGPERAKFWINFIQRNCLFPFPEKLAAQLAVVKFTEFCECGCNSFKVLIAQESAVAPVVALDHPRGAIFDCAFRLKDSEKTLELVLFADQHGNLDYVEIDCCANTFPVPEVVEICEPPFHIYASPALAALATAINSP